MTLSYKNVADILKLVDSSNLETLEVELDGMRLVVRKGASGSGAVPASPETPPTKMPIPETGDDDDDMDGEHITVGTTRVRTDGAIEVRAPMMGTFYRAPSPSDPSYVEIGQTVRAGDALCIIEVMKLFSTLKAEQGGTVTEIPAENGALVNQDDVLFVVTPA